jgi:hypothetical protein
MPQVTGNCTLPYQQSEVPQLCGQDRRGVGVEVHVAAQRRPRCARAPRRVGCPADHVAVVVVGQHLAALGPPVRHRAVAADGLPGSDGEPGRGGGGRRPRSRQHRTADCGGRRPASPYPGDRSAARTRSVQPDRRRQCLNQAAGARADYRIGVDQRRDLNLVAGCPVSVGLFRKVVGVLQGGFDDDVGPAFDQVAFGCCRPAPPVHAGVRRRVLIIFFQKARLLRLVRLVEVGVDHGGPAAIS